MKNCFYFLTCFVFSFGLQAQTTTNSSTDVCKETNFIVEFDVNKETPLKEFRRTVTEPVAKKRLKKVSTMNFDPSKHRSFAKCANLKEQEGVILCVFNHMKPMNISMLRASLYAETDIKIKDINDFFTPKDTEQGKRIQFLLGDTNKYRGLGGHDTDGYKYKEFYDEYLKVIPNNKKAKLEECFDQNVLKPVVNKYKDKFFLISANTTDYDEGKFVVDEIISHEFLHAQSPKDTKMNKNIGNYLNNLEAKKDLSLFMFLLYQVGGYPKIYSTDWLRSTEFIAYILGRNQLKKILEHKLKTIRPLAALIWKYGPYDHKKIAEQILNSYYNYFDARKIEIEKANLWWDSASETEQNKLIDDMNSIQLKEIGKNKLPAFNSGESSFFNYLKKAGTAPIIY